MPMCWVCNWVVQYTNTCTLILGTFVYMDSMLGRHTPVAISYMQLYMQVWLQRAFGHRILHKGASTYERWLRDELPLAILLWLARDSGLHAISK